MSGITEVSIEMGDTCFSIRDNTRLLVENFKNPSVYRSRSEIRCTCDVSFFTRERKEGSIPELYYNKTARRII